MKASVEKNIFLLFTSRSIKKKTHLTSMTKRHSPTERSHHIVFYSSTSFFQPTLQSSSSSIKSVNITSRFLHDAIDERQIIFFSSTHTLTRSKHTQKFTRHSPFYHPSAFSNPFSSIDFFFSSKNLSQKIIFTPSIPRADQKTVRVFSSHSPETSKKKFIPHSPTLLFNTLCYIPTAPSLSFYDEKPLLSCFFYLFSVEKTCSRQLSFFPDHDRAHASKVRSHSLSPSHIYAEKKTGKAREFFFYRCEGVEILQTHKTIFFPFTQIHTLHSNITFVNFHSFFKTMNSLELFISTPIDFFFLITYLFALFRRFFFLQTLRRLVVCEKYFFLARVSILTTAP